METSHHYCSRGSIFGRYCSLLFGSLFFCSLFVDALSSCLGLVPLGDVDASCFNILFFLYGAYFQNYEVTDAQKYAETPDPSEVEGRWREDWYTTGAERQVSVCSLSL